MTTDGASVDGAIPIASATGLRGNLGVISLVFTVIAFNGPMAILAQYIPVIVSIGNGLGLPVTFAGLGLLVVIFAVALNAMAMRMVHPGGFYTYISAGLGRPLGLSAGLLALVSYLTLGGGAFPLFAIAAQHLLQTTFHVDAENVPAWWIFGLVAWAATSILSLLNVDLSAKVLGVLASGELVIAFLWNINVYAAGGPEGRTFDMIGSVYSGSLSIALVFGILSLTGFESLQVFRAETRNPNVTVPRATYISVILLAVMYSISSYAYIISYGPTEVAAAGATDPTGAMLASIARYAGKPAADIANGLLVTSMFASALAIQNVAARYVFTLGRDRVLPPILGVANHRHGSPMVAAAVTSVICGLIFMVSAAFGISAFDCFTYFQGTAGFCLVALWTVTCTAVVAFFRRRRAIETAGLWTSTIAPAIAFVGLGIMLVLCTLHFADILGGNEDVANLALALLAALMVAGVLLALWYRSNRPDIYARIGNLGGPVDL